MPYTPLNAVPRTNNPHTPLSASPEQCQIETLYTQLPFKCFPSTPYPTSASSSAVLFTISGGFVYWMSTKRVQGIPSGSAISCSVTIFSWHSVDSTTWTWQTLLKHLYGSAQHNLVLCVWGRHVLLQVTVQVVSKQWRHYTSGRACTITT